MKTWVTNSIQGSELSENSQEQMDRLYNWGTARCLEKKNWLYGREQATAVTAKVTGYARFSRSVVKLSPQMKGDSAEMAAQAINEWSDSTQADWEFYSRNLSSILFF